MDKRQLIGDLESRLEDEQKALADSQKAGPEDKFQLGRVSLSTAGFQTKEMLDAGKRKENEKSEREKRVEVLQKEIRDNTRLMKEAIQNMSSGAGNVPAVSE